MAQQCVRDMHPGLVFVVIVIVIVVVVVVVVVDFDP